MMFNQDRDLKYVMQISTIKVKTMQDNYVYELKICKIKIGLFSRK